MTTLAGKVESCRRGEILEVKYQRGTTVCSEMRRQDSPLLSSWRSHFWLQSRRMISCKGSCHGPPIIKIEISIVDVTHATHSFGTKEERRTGTAKIDHQKNFCFSYQSYIFTKMIRKSTEMSEKVNWFMISSMNKAEKHTKLWYLKRPKKQ